MWRTMTSRVDGESRTGGRAGRAWAGACGRRLVEGGRHVMAEAVGSVRERRQLAGLDLSEWLVGRARRWLGGDKSVFFHQLKLADGS
jgi:hypothetical protein